MSATSLPFIAVLCAERTDYESEGRTFESFRARQTSDCPDVGNQALNATGDAKGIGVAGPTARARSAKSTASFECHSRACEVIERSAAVRSSEARRR